MFIIKSIDWLLLNIVNTITTINIITVTFTCKTMDCHHGLCIMKGNYFY